MMAKRKGEPYKDGELEVILSLTPTSKNIALLSALLDRSKSAIEIVYHIAYGTGPFGDTAGIQAAKVLKAKKAVGISIGRKTLPKCQ